MTRHPTSILLNDEERSQLDELREHLDTTRVAILRRALAELHQRVTTGDQWVGTGVWRGWRITTAHAASSYGQPVLVAPSGVTMAPGDFGLIPSIVLGDVLCPEEEADDH